MANFQIGPEVPNSVIRQTDDWTCAVRSSYAALWLLAQVEDTPVGDYAWWYNIMVPTYDNSDVGLKDGRGAGVAQALRSVGVDAVWYSPVTREEVAMHVRTNNLVMIGGHQWGPAGHWVLVVGVEDDGTLMLANPAGCYNLGGTAICSELLTSFSKSTWSAVVIPVEAGVPPVVQPTPPVSQDALVASLQNLVGNAYHDDGQIIPALEAVIKFLRNNRPA